MVVYYCFDHMQEVLAPVRAANRAKKKAEAFVIEDYGVTDETISNEEPSPNYATH